MSPVRLALCCLLAASTARAATLPEAIRRWTGVTTDVIGTGQAVRVTLPPGAPVPSVSMRARQTTRTGEPGWQLSDMVVPMPIALSGGGTGTIAAQHTSGWLGDHTADLDASYGGIVTTRADTRLRLDHMHVVVSGSEGPVRLAIDSDGLHALAAPPGTATLLPQHLTLRGHTTEAGAEALAAITNGQHPAGPAEVAIDTLGFDVGPAHFAGTGSVVVYGQHDRRGEVTLRATGFKELMLAMPDAGDIARLYPAMMVLRAMAEKRDGGLVWVAAFRGSQVLVNGIDIGPLLGL